MLNCTSSSFQWANTEFILFLEEKISELDGSGVKEITLANISTGHSAVGALILPSLDQTLLG